MRPHAVAFTGTGREFRRIWAFNLAANAVLAGLYTPLARRRTATYFATHTAIDGTPLAVAPRPVRSRLRIAAVVLALLASRIASELGYGLPLPGVVLVGALLLPYLWGSTSRMRVGATSWREVRPEFSAGWGEIYRASWPLFVVAGAWAAALPALVAAASQQRMPRLGAGGALALAAAVAAAFVLLVRLAFNYKQLLVTRTRVAGHAVEWQARFAEFLRIWCASATMFAACVLPIVLLARHALFGPLDAPAQLTGPAVLAVPAVGALLAIVVSAPVRAWHTARMFVLTWDGLRVGPLAQLRCTLQPRAFVALRTKNMLRALATLAASRPFGLAEEYRMKAQSITLWMAAEKV